MHVSHVRLPEVRCKKLRYRRETALQRLAIIVVQGPMRYILSAFGNQLGIGIRPTLIAGFLHTSLRLNSSEISHNYDILMRDYI